MSKKYTYANPLLSLWQSAAEDVQRRRASTHSRLEFMTASVAAPTARVATAATDVLMDPVDTLGVPLSAGQKDAVEQMFAPAPAPAHIDLAAVGQGPAHRRRLCQGSGRIPVERNQGRPTGSRYSRRRAERFRMRSPLERVPGRLSCL